MLGDIKFYRYPCWFIYDPKGYRLKGRDFDNVLLKVKPGDVLLRRFDNYLDTGFIPGFWNHAGIYLGDTMQHPSRMKFNGRVLHATSDGVIEETLFDFMKADHIAVLRPKFHYIPARLEDRIASARDKKYDFNFDFDNGDRLSCTELISYLFEGTDSGLTRDHKMFGRDILIPDAINKGNFEHIIEIRYI